MPAVIKSDDLPRLRSTRDGRDRIDLVTEELFGWTDIKADFIRYKPGDTAAAHYHVGARHIWFVVEGSAIFHLGDETHEVAEGDVVSAGDGEVHWFHNTGNEPFAIYEIWVPAPPIRSGSTPTTYERGRLRRRSRLLNRPSRPCR